VKIPLVSLSVRPEDINIDFPDDCRCDFIKALEGMLVNIKNFLIENPNDLALENKGFLERIH